MDLPRSSLTTLRNRKVGVQTTTKNPVKSHNWGLVTIVCMHIFESRLKAGVMEIKPKKTTSIAIQGSIKPYQKPFIFPQLYKYVNGNPQLYKYVNCTIEEKPFIFIFLLVHSGGSLTYRRLDVICSKRHFSIGFIHFGILLVYSVFVPKQ